MSSKFDKWRRHEYPVPKKMLHWPLRGAGFDNLGVDGKPVETDVPHPGPGQLLLRVDAVGLCFSDVKLIRAGNNHPRILGRDLQADPTRPGHEVAMTIAEVGKGLASDYSVGERFIIQAEMTYKGVRMAFGYVIPGAFSQYVIVGKEVLHGDPGNYLLPIPGGLGYAETALCEPWACVVASVRARGRSAPLAGGRALVVEVESCGKELFPPGHDVTTLRAPEGEPPQSLPGLEHFDDIVICGTPSPALAAQAIRQLNRDGVLCVLSGTPIKGKVAVDVGRIHYEGLQLVGSSTPDLAKAYEANTRSDMSGDGTAWFIGAAGPMGQMHVQRALALASPPRKVVISDLSKERVAYAMKRWQPLAEAKGTELAVVDPGAFAREEDCRDALAEQTGGRGFDDIVVLAPVPSLVCQATELAADNCLINIFAGIPVGNEAELELSGVFLRGVRFVGTSGSAIEDMQTVLDEAAAGRLNTNTSLAALGDIAQAHKGVCAVAEAKFNGKTVLFPSISDFPLVTLEELQRTEPDVGELLADGPVWTREAEARFLEKHVELAD